jgi:hypothetical protein
MPNSFSLSKTTTTIIIGSIILSLLIVIGFRRFGFLIWPELEMDPLVPYQSFSLNDTKAKYYIRKDTSGTFSVVYVPQTTSDASRSAYIGSSQVTLDKFADKSIHISGSFRKQFGTPLCWDSLICSSNKLSGPNFTVIDIQNIE